MYIAWIWKTLYPNLASKLTQFGSIILKFLGRDTGEKVGAPEVYLTLA